MKTQNKKGFTIVELVIVIAVIAILAAVLIPTFINLTKKANEANAQLEAKNLITEMLANILTGKEGDADLLVFSQKDNNVYIHGYSREAGKVITYHDSPKAIPSGTPLADYVKTLLGEMENKQAIKAVEGLAADDWRQPAKTREIVDQLDAKGEMIVYANYEISVEAFGGSHILAVNGKVYDDLSAAIEEASNGGTITFIASTDAPIVFEAKEPTTLKNITFKAAEGVKIKGLQLVGTKGNKLTLEDIKFEGISFTDTVVLGEGILAVSECSDITFENCKFDLSEAGGKKYAISRNNSLKSSYCYNVTVRGCSFKNAARGMSMPCDLRDLTVENCTFENLSSYAIYIKNAGGSINVNNNTANNTSSILSIGTLGNTYSSIGNATDVIIKDNKGTQLICKGSEEAFWATYGNAAIDDVKFTINGNTCTYKDGRNFKGFWIKSAKGAIKDPEKWIEQ